VVVVLCGDNNEKIYEHSDPKYHYNNTKLEWEKYCKQEGYPLYEFNPNDTAEKISETASKILKSLLSEIEADRGLKIKTEFFPQDCTVENYNAFLGIGQQVAKPKSTNISVWTRFKRLIGISKPVSV